MSDVLPLEPDDPLSVNGHRIVGRLGQGSRSVVYLVHARAGGRAALKLFHAGLATGAALARVADEAGRLRLASVAGVAHIIGTGMYRDRPYVVSEYVPGPTLRTAVESQGPLKGPALYRLAIGTMTALASMHQAGVQHHDLTPGNVILGSDGPRVIEPGMARATEAGATSATRPFGIPVHVTPEELSGTPAGPAADMFAWATTMLFAASGRSPFRTGSMAATTNSILGTEPDLGLLEDGLRGLVADCLAKDPSQRPLASNALLRLVGHSQILATIDPPPADLRSAPPPTPSTRVPLVPPRPPTRRRVALPSVAIGVVIAMISWGAVYMLAPRATAVQATAVSRPTPTPVRAPSVKVVQASPTSPRPPAKKLKPPGLKLTVHEHPSDPVRLTSYFIGDVKAGTYRTYVRDSGGDAFRLAARDGDYGDPAVSPDGKWIAVNPWFKFTASTTDFVTIINRATGERFAVETTGEPLKGYYVNWSPDSRRVLLTFYEFKGKTVPNPKGFVVVDVETRKATVVVTGDTRHDRGFFGWAPGGKGVTAAYVHDGGQWGLRFRDLDGRIRRELSWVGASTEPATFSPSGRSFVTYCPRVRTAVCVWDTGTGDRRTTVPVSSRGAIVRGWWDEDHLIVMDTRRDPYEYVVMDFHAKAVRTLAEIPKKDEDVAELRFSPR
ncbi:protein kinase domain-containing protein [Sphaerisporangium perillae]|uniref:protein kinase domain-containing protein n=1 Tax=Sphaerisporangium perillae TaxID=2935860 RepID=UPI00200C1D64|nr:protein kinase [Sphaerisporangium perillae]